MTRIVDDVRAWNTPIIGAYLLWCFSSGYYKNHKLGECPVVLLHFLAAPILTSAHLVSPVSDKRHGLSSYIRSFNDSKEVDLLLSLQERADKLKEHTLLAIDLGIKNNLFVLDAEDARIYPKEIDGKRSRGSGLKPEAKAIGKKAEILGKWFSEYEVPQIAAMLKVVL